MIWVVLIFVGIALVAGAMMALMASRPKPPSNIQNFIGPTTTLGKPIGVLWGKRLIRSPNVAWWGDVKITKKKVKAGGKK